MADDFVMPANYVEGNGGHEPTGNDAYTRQKLAETRYTADDAVPQAVYNVPSTQQSFQPVGGGPQQDSEDVPVQYNTPEELVAAEQDAAKTIHDFVSGIPATVPDEHIIAGRPGAILTMGILRLLTEQHPSQLKFASLSATTNPDPTPAPAA